MIYVTESDFERQIVLLNTVAITHGKSNLVAWLYQESEAKTIAGLVVSSEPQGFVPVTTYGCGEVLEQGLNTKPTEFNANLVSELLQNKAEILELYDSLALYQPSQDEWYACVIHHENLCLVKDDSMLEKLKQQKFAATTEAPSWW
jgi:hypothetical protein